VRAAERSHHDQPRGGPNSDNLSLTGSSAVAGRPGEQNMAPALDVACGPFVVEDGQFDIELI
jgi:hypothetical protein